MVHEIQPDYSSSPTYLLPYRATLLLTNSEKLANLRKIDWESIDWELNILLQVYSNPINLIGIMSHERYCEKNQTSWKQPQHCIWIPAFYVYTVYFMFIHCICTLSLLLSSNLYLCSLLNLQFSYLQLVFYSNSLTQRLVNQTSFSKQAKCVLYIG